MKGVGTQVENEIKWQQFRRFALQMLLWEVTGTELSRQSDSCRLTLFVQDTEMTFVDFIR